MITSKQRAYLKSLAQKINSTFQVGKNGVTDTLINDLQNALEANELIKITLLNTIPGEKRELAEEITEKTSSEFVQLIGNKLTIYKQSVNNPTIELPR